MLLFLLISALSMRDVLKRRWQNEDHWRQVLQKAFYYDDFWSIRPDWLRHACCGVSRNLELDFFCERLNLALEVQGQQHYQWVPRFHKTEGEFEAQQHRDKLKRRLCQQKGVVLLEAPYWIRSEDEKLRFLHNQLSELGLLHLLTAKPWLLTRLKINFLRLIAYVNQKCAWMFWANGKCVKKPDGLLKDVGDRVQIHGTIEISDGHQAKKGSTGNTDGKENSKGMISLKYQPTRLQSLKTKLASVKIKANKKLGVRLLKRKRAKKDDDLDYVPLSEDTEEDDEV